MLLPLVVLASSVKVGDLVDAVTTKAGWCYVAETFAPYAPIIRRPVEDLPTWTVAAKNRWGLVVRAEEGWARPKGMPTDGFFGNGVESTFVRSGKGYVAQPKSLRDLDAKMLAAEGGTVVTIAEIYRAARIDPAKIHWRLRSRRVRARVQAGRIGASLPALAAAIGATFDPKSETIEFEPVAFRRQVLATLTDPKYDRGELPRPDNLELAYNRIPPKTLKELMEKPENEVMLGIPGNDPGLLDVLERMSTKMGRESAALRDQLRLEVDFTSEPRLRLSTDGTALIRFRKRGGEESYWYL